MIIRCARCSCKMMRRTLRWDTDICYTVGVLGFAVIKYDIE